jgi:hypothetical protein
MEVFRQPPSTFWQLAESILPFVRMFWQVRLYVP